jgi:molecular chaperone GrpE (heat shock protein)
MGLRRRSDSDREAPSARSETVGETPTEHAHDLEPPQAHTVDGDAAGLAELCSALMSCFDDLQRIVSDGFAAQAQRQELFNRLYDDLETQKRERLNEGRLPLYRALLLVLDRLESLRASHPECASALRSVQEELLDALAIDGVTEIEQDPRSIDARRQSIVGVVASLPDAGVWRNVRSGYEIGPRVIRPQQVEVVRDPQ